MDRYFGLNKSNKENHFDIDLLQRQIDEDLLNLKIESNPVNMSYRDDMSESDVTPSYRRRNLNDSVASSLNLDGLKELQQVNFERDQFVSEFEDRVKGMRNAKNNQFEDMDYVTMTVKPIQVNNPIISEDKLAEIKQNGLTKAPQIPQNNFIEDEDDEVMFVDHPVEEEPREMSSPEKKVNKKIEIKNNFQNVIDEENTLLARRREKADQEREIYAMETEDARSMEYERFSHHQKFKDRLFTLPENFTVYREFPAQLASLQNALSNTKFGMPRISKPIGDPKKNLLEASKTEMDRLILNKVINKKKNKLNFAKINEKDKILLSKNKFDAGLAKLNPSSSVKNVEPIRAQGLLKTFNQENHSALLNQRTPSDKSLKDGQTAEKNSISKWTLNKFLTINLKLTKIDGAEIKAAIKQNASLPIAKLICSEVAANNQTTDADNDHDLDIDDTKKSFEHHVSRYQNKGIRKLELKMEELEDIKNIGQLKDLQILKLSMNKIQEIRELNSLKTLIEVDLSQNGIKSLKGLSNLKFLRDLNLEVNLITKIDDLEGCEFLESLNLNNNHITRIEGLKPLKRLKKLSLFRNKITKMDGLEDLQWLEEVDLGRNSIKEIKSIQKLPLLRKLVLYFNQIEQLPQNFSHISLSEIWLNGNKLTGISELSYFPSLKFLNLQENEISVLTQTSFIFAPNLKSLNLSFNKIESFGQLYRLLLHTNSLQQLEHSENPFLHGNTETLRAFYDNGIVELLPNLSSLNSKSVTHSTATLNKSSDNTLYDSLPLYPGRLESNIHHVDKATSKKLKRYGDAFYIQKNQLSVKTHVGLSYLSKVVDASNSAAQGRACVIDNGYSCDLVTSGYKYRQSLFKIKSLIIRVVCKIRKLKKHYQKNLSKIVRIQSFWRGYRLRKLYNVKKIVKAKRDKANFLSLGRYALKIQKAYHVFIMKRRLKRIWNLKKNIKVDMDDLEDFDDDDISIPQEPNYDDYDVKIPQNFALQRFVANAQTKPNIQAPAPVQTSLNNHKSPQHGQSVSKNGHTQKVSAANTKMFKKTDSDSDSNSEEEKSAKPESKNNDSFSVSSIRTGQSLATIRLKDVRAKASKPPMPIKEKKEEFFKGSDVQNEGEKQAYEFWLKAKQKKAPKRKF